MALIEIKQKMLNRSEDELNELIDTLELEVARLTKRHTSLKVDVLVKNKQRIVGDIIATRTGPLKEAYV